MFFRCNYIDMVSVRLQGPSPSDPLPSTSDGLLDQTVKAVAGWDAWNWAPFWISFDTPEEEGDFRRRLEEEGYEYQRSIHRGFAELNGRSIDGGIKYQFWFGTFLKLDYDIFTDTESELGMTLVLRVPAKSASR